MFKPRQSAAWPAKISERVPGRRRGKFDISNIGAEPEADPRSDGNHENIVHGQGGHPETADEISRPVNTDKALIDRVGGGQAVDQHRGASALAAKIPAHRRSLPEDPQVAG